MVMMLLRLQRGRRSGGPSCLMVFREYGAERTVRDARRVSNLTSSEQFDIADPVAQLVEQRTFNP